MNNNHPSKSSTFSAQFFSAEPGYCSSYSIHRDGAYLATWWIEEDRIFIERALTFDDLIQLPRFVDGLRLALSAPFLGDSSSDLLTAHQQVGEKSPGSDAGHSNAPHDSHNESNHITPDERTSPVLNTEQPPDLGSGGPCNTATLSHGWDSQC